MLYASAAQTFSLIWHTWQASTFYQSVASQTPLGSTCRRKRSLQLPSGTAELSECTARMLEIQPPYSPQMVHILVGCDGCDGLVLLRPLPLGAEHQEVPQVLLQSVRHVLSLHGDTVYCAAWARAVKSTEACKFGPSEPLRPGCNRKDMLEGALLASDSTLGAYAHLECKLRLARVPSYLRRRPYMRHYEDQSGQTVRLRIISV